MRVLPLLVLLLVLPAVRAAAPVHSRSPEGRYLVRLRDDVADVTAARARISGVRGAAVRSAFACTGATQYVVATCADEACVDALAALDDVVAYVEADAELRAATTHIQDVRRESWALDALSKTRLGLMDDRYYYNYTGRGVNAYVVDSGIRVDHVEFEGRASLFRSFTGSTCDDCNGHGTHVAGTVGGRTYGVAKDVRLLGVQVLNEYGSGYNSVVIQGICFVVSNGQLPAVIVLSLGGNSTLSLDTTIREAYNAGFYSVVAAGNDALSACLFSPARSLVAITVGNHNERGEASPSSNYGECVRVWAPGDLVRSAYYRSPTDVAVMSGTSMAAPHVGGIVAMLFEQNPWLSFDEIVSLLQTQSKEERLYDPNNLLFPEGSPVAYSLIQATPCVGRCETQLGTLASGQTFETTVPFELQKEGDVGVWVYARNFAGSTATYTVTVTLEAQTAGGQWEAAAASSSGQAGQRTPVAVALTTLPYAAGTPLRVRVQRSGTTPTLELRVLVQAPLACSADTTCSSSGECLSLGGNSTSASDNSTTSAACECFAGYSGGSCEVYLRGKLNNVAMIFMFFIGFVASTVAMLRSCRKRPAGGDTTVVISSSRGEVVNENTALLPVSGGCYPDDPYAYNRVAPDTNSPPPSQQQQQQGYWTQGPPPAY